jgi:hypothetical protein
MRYDISRMKTRVYITIDTECAEERDVRGRLRSAQGYDIRVWGRFANQAKELGIGLIMNELEAQGLCGTFFTEVFGSQSFGMDGLREVVRAIVARGHDVQLHTHPIQRVADWRTRGVSAAPDDISAYAVAEQAELLREGVRILEACGAPNVRSFRAGNFGANNATWEAMARAGLVLSSNYNPCYFDKNCAMRVDQAHPGLFEVPGVPGVWELPIANFREGEGRYRHVQITAVSLGEMKNYLLQAHGLGIHEVCVVTHSFEFCHIVDPAKRIGRKNAVNLGRLRGLCRFLAQRSDLFEVDTAGALATRLAAGQETAHPNGARGYVQGKPHLKAFRLVEQAIKRIDARLGAS